MLGLFVVVVLGYSTLCSLTGSGETGRRQRFRPFGRPLRRRPIGNRRKEPGEQG